MLVAYTIGVHSYTSLSAATQVFWRLKCTRWLYAAARQLITDDLLFYASPVMESLVLTEFGRSPADAISVDPAYSVVGRQANTSKYTNQKHFICVLQNISRLLSIHDQPVKRVSCVVMDGSFIECLDNNRVHKQQVFCMFNSIL